MKGIAYFARDGARSENLSGQVLMRRLLYCLKSGWGGGARPPASPLLPSLFANTSVYSFVLAGVTSNGYTCGTCKLKAHKSCVSNVVVSCKWITLKTVDDKSVTTENVRKTTIPAIFLLSRNNSVLKTLLLNLD